MTRTPAEEFVANRREKGRTKEFKPSNRIAKLPFHKVKETKKIPIQSDPRAVFQKRKIHLISKKNFDRLDRGLPDPMFGTIRIRGD